MEVSVRLIAIILARETDLGLYPPNWWRSVVVSREIQKSTLIGVAVAKGDQRSKFGQIPNVVILALCFCNYRGATIQESNYRGEDAGAVHFSCCTFEEGKKLKLPNIFVFTRYLYQKPAARTPRRLPRCDRSVCAG